MAGPAARPAVAARFPGFDRGYESFYVRAVDPERPRAVWLRHTVHQAEGEPPLGSIWVTLFDADEPAPAAHKVTVPGPRAGDGAWVRVGDSAFGPDGVRGSAGPAAYDLRWTGTEEPLRHLPHPLMYRAPLPRTKLESPLPAVTVSGTARIGERAVQLDGWRGMVGHNWGDQHAERWIWLHGVAFDGDPDAWVDLALGRVKLGPLTTPWIANGVVSARGERRRIGGRATVRESPLEARIEAGGFTITARSPREQTVVWRYADPEPGSEHHTANSSVAAVEVTGHGLRLATPHGGVYELGMRETAHGLAVQPFPDP